MDWINGKVRERASRGTPRGIQRQLHGWWRAKANVRRRESDWAVHIICEHDRDPDAWAKRVPKRKGRVGWMKGSCVEGCLGVYVVSGTGVAGVWCGIWVTVFSLALGWHTVNNKCESVFKGSALDAEIRGCEMFMKMFGHIDWQV